MAEHLKERYIKWMSSPHHLNNIWNDTFIEKTMNVIYLCPEDRRKFIFDKMFGFLLPRTIRTQEQSLLGTCTKLLAVPGEPRYIKVLMDDCNLGITGWSLSDINLAINEIRRELDTSTSRITKLSLLLPSTGYPECWGPARTPRFEDWVMFQEQMPSQISELSIYLTTDFRKSLMALQSIESKGENDVSVYVRGCTDKSNPDPVCYEQRSSVCELSTF